MSSFIHEIGKIFQPLLDLFGTILAFFYSIIPNYPIDVTLLTIAIMAVLTPLTVKSTKSMAAMQAIAPEMKKLQQKYKGAENRMQLQEEMMKLYKEHNVNPASGCLPMLLQMPAFFILYEVIRGLTNTQTIHGVVHAAPRYIPHDSAMYAAIVRAKPPGSLNAFGIDFAQKLFSHHSSIFGYLPFAILVLLAVGLQYLQMSRLNARNPQAAQANPQMASLQKYMPLIFGFIYLNIAAIINVYFVISSAIRIATQEVLFRRGIVPGPAQAKERELNRERAVPDGKPKPDGKKAAPEGGKPTKGTGTPKAAGGAKPAPSSKGAGGQRGVPKGAGGSTGKGAGQGAKGPRTGRGSNGASRNGAGGNHKGARAEGARRNGAQKPDDGAAKAKPHPRSKSKRQRRAR